MSGTWCGVSDGCQVPGVRVWLVSGTWCGVPHGCKVPGVACLMGVRYLTRHVWWVSGTWCGVSDGCQIPGVAYLVGVRYGVACLVGVPHDVHVVTRNQELISVFGLQDKLA